MVKGSEQERDDKKGQKESVEGIRESAGRRRGEGKSLYTWNKKKSFDMDDQNGVN